MTKFDDMMKKKRYYELSRSRGGKFGGPHIDYIILLLDFCKVMKSASDVYYSSGIRYKYLILKLLRWAVNINLLNKITHDRFVYYVTTPFGRRVLKILQEYDKA